MGRLRDLVRNILLEYHGVQNEIKDLSRELTIEVAKKINSDLDKIDDGNIWDLISQVRLNADLSEKIGFSMITIKIEYQKSDTTSNGVFESDKTRLLDDGTYSILINLKVSNKTNNQQIEYILSHELNHAFVNIKDLRGRRMSSGYNRTNKAMRSELKIYSEKYPEIKEFLNMTYLSNPLEIQARVQETFGQIKGSNKETANDTIKYLLKFQPLSDARKMMAYSSDKILQLDEETLKKIIDSFNEHIKINSKDRVRTFSDTNSFFKYWNRVINKSGEKLARKIYKLVSDKHSIHESILYEHSSFRWVFGQDFEQWFFN